MARKAKKSKRRKKGAKGGATLAGLNKRVTGLEKIITKSGMKSHYGS
jgi:hypothetical protein